MRGAEQCGGEEVAEAGAEEGGDLHETQGLYLFTVSR